MRRVLPEKPAPQLWVSSFLFPLTAVLVQARISVKLLARCNYFFFFYFYNTKPVNVTVTSSHDVQNGGAVEAGLCRRKTS